MQLQVEGQAGLIYLDKIIVAKCLFDLFDVVAEEMVQLCIFDVASRYQQPKISCERGMHSFNIA